MVTTIRNGVEVVKCYFHAGKLTRLFRAGVIDSGDFDPISVELYNEEYPHDPLWVKLKHESNTAYKRLKDYEYDKRIEAEANGEVPFDNSFVFD